MEKPLYLYMDTSDHLVLGLLDQDFSWIDYLEIEGAKNSGKIHAAIYQMLTQHGALPKDLKAVIQNAGPGSYTGMRVSEGISQVFEWQGIPVFSFFHFEVPELLGVREGYWLAKAFKGEFFVSSWKEGQQKTELLDFEKASELIKVSQVYCHFHLSLSKDFPEFSKNFLETGALIKEHSSKLLSQVFKRQSRLSPYYFRSIDQEFKVPR